MEERWLEDGDSGHYITGGLAVVAMGGVGALWYGLTVYGVVGEGFIDSLGIAVISMIFVATGGLMVLTGRREGEA